MSSQSNVPKIAIVGLATQYPDADTPAKFWQNLLDKKDSRSTISSQKLNANPADYQGVQGESDRFYCDKGGYIQNFSFDANGYRIPAEQFNGLDDSFLWATDTARKALNDAGVDITNPQNNGALNRTGIIMGTLSFPTAKSNELFVPLYHSAVEKALQDKLQQPSFTLQPFDSERYSQQTTPASLSNGAIAHNASKLVADALGLGAAQLSLDAACASSVYSLKLACDYLHTGKADMMLAGAVSGADPFFINMGFSIFHAYPDHGISAPFDSNSKGLFAGEGAGVLVLKRLEDAERDGDHIYALVSGIGLSNDGKGQFVLSPNSDGQVKAFERAYADAAMHDKNFGPDKIEVLECHATGTPLGDKVELTSMERFFSDKLNGSNTPLIGSAKSNLGHLLTAAGMPGIMKMIFAMRQGVLPPSINISAPIASPSEMFGPATLPNDVLPWPDKAGNTARHAGVSVFGFGGCNAHLLVESYFAKSPDAALSTPNNASVTPATTINAQMPMHITGMASHFGSLSTVNAFADAVNNNQTAFTSLPVKRWKGLDKHPELLQKFGLSQAAPTGAYIDQFDFDFLRFKVPPNEDDRLISQQLLLMKVADEAIHDAKLAPGSKVAVLVAMETELELHQFRGRVNLHTQIAASLNAHGVSLSDDEYQALETIAMDSVLDAAKLNQYTSFIGNIMASRISSLWDFNGPAFTISAGEQSVNRCIDVAQNLLAMESRQEPLDAVIIAAVDLSGSIENIVLKTASIDKTGSNQALNIGEGAGAIVLQAAAIDSEHCDLIHQGLGALDTLDSASTHSYGTIDSLAFGHTDQLSTISDDVLTPVGLAATDIDLLELNQAPDLLNIDNAQMLSQLFSQSATSKAQSCIGHTFAASGIASLLHGLLKTRLNASVQNASSDSKLSNKPNQKAIIATLSENQCSQLLISQNAEQASAISMRMNTDIQAQTAKKLSLVKQVSLGGRDIYQHIVNAPLANIDSIRAKAAKLNPVAPTTVMNLHDRGQFIAPAHANSAPMSANNNSMTTETSMPFSDRSTQFNPTPKVATPTAQVAQATQSAQTSSVTNSAATVSQVPPPHLSAFEQNQWLAHQAQLAFLKSREQGLKVADALLKQEIAQANGQPYVAQSIAKPVAPIQATNVLAQPVAAPILRPDHANVPPYTAPIPADKPCIWNYADLVEYAEGDIAKVFGPDYAVIDNYSRRVRLPTTDYLLVSRVTKLDATMNQYKPCSMTTEYDIPEDAPYLVDGQIPWAVAVESGQCDLMLISYLGIDFENKGERVYRLLDCTLTFLGDLPRGGDTLRYDIKINNFAKNGETLLFFFSYECFVGDKMVLKMDGGCAGFFTDQELDDGKGVIYTEDEIKTREAALNTPNKPRFEPLLHCAQTQFDYSQIHHLLNADIGSCFAGEHHNHQQASGKQDSLCFASEKFLMIEQVGNLDVHGGAWGLGFIEGHKQLAPNHWYFPCHFQGDQVMAGSLMAEGCGQLLQFFMLHIGMHTLVENGRFQPLENASQKVRCRGQVLPQHGELTYRMEVTEIGTHPRPYAKANIEILLNGKAVVDFQNLGVMIKEEGECTRYTADSTEASAITSGANTSEEMTKNNSHNTPASLNAPLMAQVPDLSAPTNKGVIPLQHVEAPVLPDYPNRTPDTLPFTAYHMFEFATGDIENCFGPDFSIYRGFIPPRTPCGDLQLTTRVVDIQGKRGELKKPSSCIAEYEVPTDAWYFAKNSHASVMPYSVLMEISLQPNGFISGYMGTTLGFPGQELFFRNLDGSGELLRDVDLRGKTIVNDSKLLSTVIAGSNIIQSFSFDLSVDGEPFYTGSAVFGYFKSDALKNQLGIDNGRITQPWHIENNVPADITVDLLDKQSRVFHAPANQPHYRLAGGQLNFIDKAEIVDKGGKNGLGYLSASRTIDPSDWFFQFHFHQDPVMPGSLGVEAIIELMQTYAISKDLGKGFTNPKFGQILSDIKWKYRGQINPLNKQMSLDVHISAVKDENGKRIIVGDANLSKDGLRIYEVKDIAICIEEA